MAAGPVLGAAPLDTGTNMVVGTAPGVAVPVAAVDPTADVDVDTADYLLARVADFDPTSAWDDDAASSSPDLTGGTADGATATAASAARHWHGCRHECYTTATTETAQPPWQ